MSRHRLGIAVGRREVRAVGLERTGREFAVGARWQTARTPGESLSIALERILASIPGEWREAEVHLGLSPVDLACADLLEVSYRNENQLMRVAPSLAEGRCAGETVEELAIDVLMSGRVGDGSLIQLAALRREKLKSLNALLERLLPKASVGLVTAIPFALLRAAPEGDGLWGLALEALGEGVVWERKGGEVRCLRVFPMETRLTSPHDAVDTGSAPSPRIRSDSAFATTPWQDKHVGPLPRWGEGLTLIEQNARALNPESAELHILDGPIAICGLKTGAIAPDELAAVGAALLDPDRSLNLLRGSPDAPRSLLEHLKAPLLASAVAATVLFMAAGLYFDRCARQHEQDLARCDEKEKDLWKAVLPSETYQPGTLADRLEREEKRAQQLKTANAQPSALRLWAELTKVLPDPDRMSLKLEDLQLTRRGGRLQAKVPVVEGNPLQNASLIESSINRSAVVSARGEFERREGQISVRMQLDYKPTSGRGRAP